MENVSNAAALAGANGRGASADASETVVCISRHRMTATGDHAYIVYEEQEHCAPDGSSHIDHSVFARPEHIKDARYWPRMTTSDACAALLYFNSLCKAFGAEVDDAVA